MADVRSLLRNERAARQISHPHATYSTTGTLVCLVCHIQLKSESLWNGHLRSPQHAMRLQRIRDGTLGRPPGAPAPDTPQDGEEDLEETATDVTNGQSTAIPLQEVRSKKRKADDGDEEDSIRKRSKAGEIPDDFFDEGVTQEIGVSAPVGGGQETKLPSRPATPLKTPPLNAPPDKLPAVDEDEWAAFEADIAASTAAEAALLAEEAVISAPAMSAADIAAKSREEESAQRKERQEAEMEGEKEDAARKLEEEFEEMAELEERIKKLKEKREALRVKGDAQHTTLPSVTKPPVMAANGVNDEEDDDDDDEEDDDDWDGFRLKA